MESITRTDALIQLAQAQGAAPHGAAHWASYSGGAAIYLAIVLIVVASGFAYAGRRLRVPLKVMRPEGTAAGFMIAIWLLAIYTDGIAAFVYGLHVKEAYPGFVAARVRVGTFVYAFVTFFVILYVTRRWGWKVALASAVIGTAAAPMLFELPFDLIVMARTNPPIPTRPMLYRQLFFLPLFLVELSTISMLTLLPSMRVTAYACFAMAAMFVVFAVWATFGFAFPAEPLPLALNVIAKILCFVAAIMLFIWRADKGISANASPRPLAACAPGPFSTRGRTVMIRVALTAVFATSLTVSGAAQEFMAQSGAPASSFPQPDRPVAHIVSPIWKDEKARDDAGEPGQLVRLLGIKPGMTVADVGAGSGYYVVRLSPIVGPNGRIIAEDVVPEYLQGLGKRVRDLGLRNVTVTLGEPHDPKLPIGSVDVAVLVHMYHEVTQPYGLLYNLVPALKPNARVGIVDAFAPTSEHGTPPNLLRCELAAVGYRKVSFDRLKGSDTYLAVFAPPSVASRTRPEAIVACRAR